MTAEFTSPNSTESCQGDSPTIAVSGNTNQSTGVKYMLERDRFELLSAYLDGEVTAAEQRQVEDWLANDPEIKCLYARLLKIRQGLKNLPVPPAQQPVERTVEQVFTRISRRARLSVAWGGAAVAALLVGVLSSVLPGEQSITPQLAQYSELTTASTETLMVALNAPVIEIPKAAVATPEKAQTEKQQKGMR